MSFSLTAMLLGYFCIFKAHLAQHKFFGYDFHRGAWAEWARVAHAWLGYVVISLSFFQAVVGIAKLNSHKLGERRFRFHGQVGKATMFAGAAVMLLAVKFWAWSMSIKIAVVALVVSAVFIGVSQPRPAPEGERNASLAAKLDHEACEVAKWGSATCASPRGAPWLCATAAVAGGDLTASRRSR
eukprot:CAMPEP_0170393326 /NCGR_PEP_ID=MMETSP0117_2-20130122/20668_1 /TAXON_ID=400756 /ORGANISM="Durinskia baltica, Strain CSIRO CS-38" /LENGTH=183 /DNA_ID=CAMNT_0010649527 /DNA_START=63 /DNA_END=611 /DNA_ORIENTATION=-